MGLRPTLGIGVRNIFPSVRGLLTVHLGSLRETSFFAEWVLRNNHPAEGKKIELCHLLILFCLISQWLMKEEHTVTC